MKFGTSGLRGLASDLLGRPSALYATAFGLHLLETGQARKGDVILIGRDFRESSPAIMDNCAAALAGLGFAVVDCGHVPTPALALEGLRLGAGALMITGSHIPADRNGIKFYRPDGEIDKADEEAISTIAARLDRDGAALPKAEPSAKSGEEDCLQRYFARYERLLSQNALSGLRIGVYQHSSVARDFLKRLLSHYGAEVVPLGRSESFVPVDTEAVSPATLALLAGWAHEHALDALVSTDGDADRPLVADEAGLPLRGDVLGLVAAGFLAAETVVTPVTSNSGIERTGGFETRRTRVGSPYVIAGMKQALEEGKAGVMGFEANGGLLTASIFNVAGMPLAPLPTRDCVLPILAVLGRSARDRLPLSRIAESFALPFAVSDRLENFPTETSRALMAHLAASPANLADFLAPLGKPAAVDETDGLRVTLEDGRVVHLRPSGNAPEMRCYAEAPDEEAARALLAAGLEAIGGFAATIDKSKKA